MDDDLFSDLAINRFAISGRRYVVVASHSEFKKCLAAIEEGTRRLRTFRSIERRIFAILNEWVERENWYLGTITDGS